MLKTTKFYSHLINLSDLKKQLGVLKLNAEELEDIHTIIDDIFDHHIIDSLLDILPSTHHEEFISLHNDSPHDRKLLDFLQDKTTTDAEIKIITTAEIIKKEIILDVCLCDPKRLSKKAKNR